MYFNGNAGLTVVEKREEKLKKPAEEQRRLRLACWRKAVECQQVIFNVAATMTQGKLVRCT